MRCALHAEFEKIKTLGVGQYKLVINQGNTMAILMMNNNKKRAWMREKAWKRHIAHTDACFNSIPIHVQVNNGFIKLFAFITVAMMGSEHITASYARKTGGANACGEQL